MPSLLWDQHTCLPLQTTTDVAALTRYRRPGGVCVSVNAGYSPHSYSHACMRAVWDHPRKITDEQARACAATGGVIGITGVGIFLGPNTATLEAMTRHLEYAVDLVGIDHVGVSTDFSFDQAEFRTEVARHPHLFDDSYTRWGPIRWLPPETLLRLGEHLTWRGWTRADVDAVLGGNFVRVARHSWPV